MTEITSKKRRMALTLLVIHIKIMVVDWKRRKHASALTLLVVDTKIRRIQIQMWVDKHKKNGQCILRSKTNVIDRRNGGGLHILSPTSSSISILSTIILHICSIKFEHPICRNPNLISLTTITFNLDKLFTVL